MSDTKPSAGGGAGGPPDGEQLTREQVMAQRAEKKKLKEARKNKGGGGGAPAAEGGQAKPKPDNKDKPAEAQKPKKPQLQQQKQQKPPQQQQPSSTEDKPQQQQQQQKQQQKPKAPPNEKKSPVPKSSNPEISASAAPLPKIEELKITSPTAPSLSTDSKGKRVTPPPPEKIRIEYAPKIKSLFTQKTKVPSNVANFQLHPLFYTLGLKLRNEVIHGTNQRCVTLLNTIKEFVVCFQVPSGMTLKISLSEEIKMNMLSLKRKCPFSLAMTNAVDFVHSFLTKLEERENIKEMKEEITEEIERYVEEKIEKAVDAIVYYGLEKIRSGDVIMVYSITEALIGLLDKAGEEGRQFELITLHTPDNMGDIRKLLEKLQGAIDKKQVRMSTVNFSNAIYRMRNCTKLIIGGHGIFTTGGVMAQTGSGQLALLASNYNKPTMFLCETYKFCDRSPLDFFTLDEYDQEQATKGEIFEPKIKYDITPASLVTVVITDIDMLPSNSVPAVLRVQEGRAPKSQELIN